MEPREQARVDYAGGRPTPAFLSKLRELHELIRSNPVPCECGAGIATKIRTRNQHIEVLCYTCAAASPLERRRRRTDAVLRGRR